MKYKLKDLVEVTSGIYAKSYSAGEVYYLQTRDFDQYFLIKKGLESKLLWDQYTERHFLSLGDLLIVAKGFDHFATVYKKEYTPAVASTAFIILRNIDQEKLLPDFLAWYLNHPKTQLYLKGVAKGTSLPSLDKSVVGNLIIELPSLEKQEIIMKVSELRKTEKRLMHEIDSLKEHLINQQLFDTLKSS